LAFDAAGDILASGAFREVKLWRRPRVTALADVSHDAPLQLAALSPDGKTAAVGDAQGRIRVWPTAAAKESKVIAAHDAAVTGLAFSADGASLVSCSLDRSIRLWNVADGTAAGKTLAPASLHALAILREVIVVGDAEGIVRVGDIAALRRGEVTLRDIKAHDQAVAALAPVPDSDDFYSGSSDGFVRRWHAPTGNKSHEIQNGAPIVALAERPDGHGVAVASAESVKLYRDDAAKPVAMLQGDPRLAAVVPRIDGEIALTKGVVERTKQDLKSYEGLERAVKVRADDVKKAEMELLQAKAKRDEKQLVANKASDSKGSVAAVKALAEAEVAVGVAETVVERAQATAKRTAEKLAAAHKDLAAREESLRELEAAKTASLAEAKASRLAIRSLAFSADGRRLAVGCDDGAIHFHDADSGIATESHTNHKGAVRSVTFAKTGHLLTASADRRTLLWDASSEWRLLRTIGAPNRPEVFVDRVLALDFSRDGKRLATGGGAAASFGELKIWNVADGSLLRAIPDAHADTIFGVRFSPDGLRLATASADRFLKIFDPTTGQLIRVFDGHTAHVLGVGWRGDGHMLVSCGADTVLKLWDADSGSLVRTLKGGVYDNGRYKREVTSVAFIGDSEEILAASGDGTVRLHRVSSENDIMKFNGVSGYQYAVAATPNGQVVISAGSDGVLRVWSGHDLKPKQTFTP
jgi:WD40 repeat protein